MLVVVLVTAAAFEQLKANQRYRVAGLVLVRQRPGTAKGVTFMTLEDETGGSRQLDRLAAGMGTRYRRVGRLAWAVTAAGLLQQQDGMIHLNFDRLQDLTEQLPQLGHLSRDFH